MAHWTLEPAEHGDTLFVVYRNKVTGKVFSCGEVRADTPKAMLVEWCVREAGPFDYIRIGDVEVVVLPDRKVRA